MTQILLIGTDLPLLEGLAQTFASLGFTPIVAQSISEGREIATVTPPLVALIGRALVMTGTDALSVPLAPGGALMLYRSATGSSGPLAHAVQRNVLADLTLPLERNRLVALVQRVDERARATGRTGTDSSHHAPPA
jgi:hypothetical protein